ncbi:MAG: DUF1016 domain-containing protein [Nitrospinae bacterium]|nr:DUF1016 domain-containing protein [Nitrospinota bacterium]
MKQPVSQFIKVPPGYKKLFEDLKDRIRTSQLRAGLAVNKELVLLYWDIGRQILQRQQEEGWGAKVIDRLSRDLRREFPEMKGFSRANLLYMRTFADAYPDNSFVQQVAGQIPWFHNCILLDKVKDTIEREWYIRQTIQHGWSRNILAHHIESGLYHRQGKAITNFDRTLPTPQSELAQQILKDTYIFDFLNVGKEAKERDLEKALLEKLREFLLELGVGFSFVGSQYHLEVGGQDFYIDLLFYHLRLRCFVVIDLKIGEFQPEYAGKMNFYLSAVDDMLRHKELEDSSYDPAFELSDDYFQTVSLANFMYATLVVAIWSEIELFLKSCVRLLYNRRRSTQNVSHKFPEIKKAIKEEIGIQPERCKSYSTVNATRELNNSFKHSNGYCNSKSYNQIQKSLLTRKALPDRRKRDTRKIGKNVIVEYSKLPLPDILNACNEFCSNLLNRVESKLKRWH